MSNSHALQQIVDESAIAARGATDTDPASDVLELGIAFWYLKADGDHLARSAEASPTMPTRIVLDLDTHRRMLAEREHPDHADGATAEWIIGVTITGRPVQILLPVATPQRPTQ